METYFEKIEEASSQLARERALTDLRNLARDTEALVKATALDASDTVKEARSRVTAALERAKATCADLQSQAFSAAKAAARKTDQTIRRHPYESIGLAFGVGLLLGVLAIRRGSPGKESRD